MAAYCVRLKHDPEKWIPVSRLREAQAPVCRFVRCFGGRRQVGKDHAQTISESEMTIQPKTISL
jgi:hypothetical protein